MDPDPIRDLSGAEPAAGAAAPRQARPRGPDGRL